MVLVCSFKQPFYVQQISCFEHKCTKFDFGWGSTFTTDPLGSSQRSPYTSYLHFTGPTSKGKERNARGGKGMERDERGKEGRGRRRDVKTV